MNYYYKNLVLEMIIILLYCIGSMFFYIFMMLFVILENGNITKFQMVGLTLMIPFFIFSVNSFQEYINKK